MTDKEQFIISTIQPMAEHTFPYLTSIIGIVNATQGEHVGSGLRCILRERRAVVTARHVIEAAIQFPHGFSLSTDYGRSPYVVAGAVHLEHAADLAIYFLPDDYPAVDDTTSFWPQSRIQGSGERISTDYLFVHGFPQEKSKFLQIFNGVVSKSLPYGAMQRLENLPTDLQPFQFALDFDPANMRGPQGGAAESIDPHGLNGSAVWRIGISGQRAADWSPQLSQVIGFITQWRPDEKLLVASSASKLLERISSL